MEALKFMVEAGIDEGIARRCLKKADNNMERAMEFAITNNYADVPPEPV